MENKISSKQEEWANDIKYRLEIMKNAFLDKKHNLDLDEVKVNKALKRCDSIINCNKIYFIIDEYKGINDEFLVKLFDMENKKYCNIFIALFEKSGLLYQLQQKNRLEQQKKLKEIFKKYSKRS